MHASTSSGEQYGNVTWWAKWDRFLALFSNLTHESTSRVMNLSASWEYENFVVIEFRFTDAPEGAAVASRVALEKWLIWTRPSQFYQLFGFVAITWIREQPPPITTMAGSYSGSAINETYETTTYASSMTLGETPAATTTYAATTPRAPTTTYAATTTRAPTTRAPTTTYNPYKRDAQRLDKRISERRRRLNVLDAPEIATGRHQHSRRLQPLARSAFRNERARPQHASVASVMSQQAAPHRSSLALCVASLMGLTALLAGVAFYRAVRRTATLNEESAQRASYQS
jgi:hypothetical protein